MSPSKGLFADVSALLLLSTVTVQHDQFLAGRPALLIVLPMALQSHHSDWGARLLLEAQALLIALPPTLAARASLEALWFGFSSWFSSVG